MIGKSRWFDRRSKGGRLLLSGMLMTALLLGMTGSVNLRVFAAEAGTVTCDSGNVREKASSNAACAFGVKRDEQVVILSEEQGEDGFIWYEIQVRNKTGYLRSDLVQKDGAVKSNPELSLQKRPEQSEKTPTGNFEQDLMIFPQGYREKLRALHAMYPGWQFVPVNCGLDWEEVITQEATAGRNLVAMSAPASHKATDPQTFQYTKDEWNGFGDGSYASASKELIRYYMDPRNFLDENSIYQFESLAFRDGIDEATVAKVLAGSFMSGSYTDTDGITRSYASTFLEAGRKEGVNPCHLAIRCLQEQGVIGADESISGTVSGYENCFNYFNIGACAADGNSAVVNGLKYASGEDGNYGRPWNTRARSIQGAAAYIAEQYIRKGQNTLYFQKFNVVNQSFGLYRHQYMYDLGAAATEGRYLKGAQPDPTAPRIFRIPFYENMPKEPCARPTSTSNPNNTLQSLTVEGGTLRPEFSPLVTDYELLLDASMAEVSIRAESRNPFASIGGTGTVPINIDQNEYYVVCKAQNGSVRKYILKIVRK